jgi:hypothetical protein
MLVATYISVITISIPPPHDYWNILRSSVKLSYVKRKIIKLSLEQALEAYRVVRC